MINLALYIRQENLDSNQPLQEAINMELMVQTSLSVFTSLDLFKCHNVVFIDLTFEHDELVKVIEIINERYLSTRDADWPLYMFVYLFTSSEITQQFLLPFEFLWPNNSKEVKNILAYYNLPNILCSVVQLWDDVSTFRGAYGKYGMGYWGYCRYGHHLGGK